MEIGFAGAAFDADGRLRRLLRRRAGFACRLAAVIVLGACGLFIIGGMTVGYLNGGIRTSYGVGLDTQTGQTVELDSRLIYTGRYTLLSVTPAGQGAGFAPGALLDMTQWTLARKLGFAFPTLPLPSMLAEHQSLEAVIAADSVHQRSREIFLTHIVDLLVRLVLLGSALLIIQFSHGRAALAAGLYLAVASIADSSFVTFAGLPAGMQAVAITMASLARPLAYVARVAFSMELCPAPPRIKRTMWVVFAALLAVVVTLSVGDLATLLFDAPIIPAPLWLLPLAQCLTQIYSLGIFAFAAIVAPKGHRFVLRTIFAATFITLASYLIQEVYLLAGMSPPIWLAWYFSLALLGVGIGYPWAIFARRIAGVDFIISRGVAYAISVIIILGAINLAKSIVQQLAGDWMTGFVLIYGIPVVLSLSFNWLQSKTTRLIGVVLDGDLRNAALKMKALRGDFPKVANLPALAEMVAQRAAPALHMQCATIYRKDDAEIFCPVLNDAAFIPAADPALVALQKSSPVELQGLNSALTGGLLFELHVFGQTVGALHCGARPHDKGYDPAERALLKDLAYEIAVAMICLDAGVKADLHQPVPLLGVG